jgi:hypothetical protein
MANARFIFTNEWDGASLNLASGTESARLPLVNTQRYNNSRTFRTTNTDDVIIKGDLAYPTPLGGFVLWRHNLSEDATIRFKVYKEAGQSGEVLFDSGTLPAVWAKTLGELDFGTDPLGASAFTNWRLRYSSYWFPKEPSSSFEVLISDPNNADGFLEVCRIYLGQYFEPLYNVDQGHSIEWQSTTTQRPTAGGSVHSLDTEGYRTISFSLSHILETERAELFEAMRTGSKHKDIFFSMLPNRGGSTERDYSFAAKITQMPTFVSQVGRYENTFKLREV